MSQMTATARIGLRAPARQQAAPHLHVVTGDAARRSGVGFVVFCTALLVAAMLTLLLLNTKRAEASFRIHDLQASSGVLADTEDTLRAGLELQESPAHLAAAAAARGMVPSSSAAFIRPSDGKIFGVATKTKAQPDFKVVEQAAPGPASTSAVRADPRLHQRTEAADSRAGLFAAQQGQQVQDSPRSTTSPKSTTTKR